MQEQRIPCFCCGMMIKRYFQYKRLIFAMFCRSLDPDRSRTEDRTGPDRTGPDRTGLEPLGPDRFQKTDPYHHIIIPYHHIIISSNHHPRRKSVSQFWAKSHRKNRKSFLNPLTKERRNLIFWGNVVIFRGESAVYAQKFVGPPKRTIFDLMLQFRSENFMQKNVWGVEKSNVGDRLKRVLTKFHADRSLDRGVIGRSNF